MIAEMSRACEAAVAAKETWQAMAAIGRNGGLACSLAIMPNPRHEPMGC